MEELGKGRGGVWFWEGSDPSGLGSVPLPSVLVLNQAGVPDLFSRSQQQHETSARYSSPWAASGSCGRQEEKGSIDNDLSKAPQS